MKSAFILISLFTVILAQNVSSSIVPTKKLYVCPKHFVRVGRRCYFFSKNSATWQEANHKCQDRQSYIAIIKTANQDRRIRKILSRPTHAFHERWIGGMYNWKRMKWVWATTGKPLAYQGFNTQNFTESQKWHCIIMDPVANYKWNTRPCLQSKPYICHTKSKVVIRKIEEDNHNDILLNNNEIREEPANLKKHIDDFSLTNQNDAPAISPRQKRKRRNRKKKINNTTILLHRPRYSVLNATDIPTNGKHNMPMETIKYEIYKEGTSDSLYPSPIVEAYSFVKKK